MELKKPHQFCRIQTVRRWTDSLQSTALALGAAGDGGCVGGRNGGSGSAHSSLHLLVDDAITQDQGPSETQV
jgi:hypothetical protein